MIETSQIWWRQITGARKFLDKPANALANGKSSVICLSKETPWLEDMREILREFLNKKFGGIKAVREVNASVAMILSPNLFPLDKMRTLNSLLNATTLL